MVLTSLHTRATAIAHSPVSYADADISALIRELLEERATVRTIYIASKTKHAQKWRDLRSVGYPIISTWIDESGIGETSDFADLWSRCVSEAFSADAMIVYAEPGDILKGAWVEVGAALAAGNPVYGIGCEGYSHRHHPYFRCVGSVEEALAALGEPIDRAGVEG